MLLAKLQDVLLADKRLAAGEHIQMRAQLFAFRNDPVHLLVGQGILVVIGARPAADAVHIAGHSRVKENEPRDIAAVNFATGPDFLRPPEKCLKAEGENRFFGISGVRMIQNIADETHPAMIRVRNIISKREVFLIGEGFAHKVPGKLQNLQVSFCALLLPLVCILFFFNIQLIQQSAGKFLGNSSFGAGDQIRHIEYLSFGKLIDKRK